LPEKRVPTVKAIITIAGWINIDFGKNILKENQNENYIKEQRY
jgi:hypothetical protein